MKGLMIFANYFEDVEGIATVDVLRRALVDLDCVTLEDNELVLGAHGNKFIFDKRLSNIDYKQYDFLILPGGKAVFKYLRESKKVEEIVRSFYEERKLICAICAAPSVIGKLGYFEGLEYACFPGCNEIVTKGTLSNKPIVVNDRFITARSMYYTNDFALEIIKRVKGNEVALEIEKQIKGL